MLRHVKFIIRLSLVVLNIVFWGYMGFAFGLLMCIPAFFVGGLVGHWATTNNRRELLAEIAERNEP
jgi:hypothetical protein